MQFIEDRNGVRRAPLHREWLSLSSGSRISMLHGGRGDPVVFLHGSASDSEDWRDLAGRIGLGREVVCPDLPGYGESPAWSGRAAMRIGDDVAILERLSAMLARPLHIVAHGYGASMALEFAVRSPYAVASMVLYEPISFHLLHPGFGGDLRLLESVERMVATVRFALANGDYHGGAGSFFDFWNGGGAWQDLPEQRRHAIAARLSRIALDQWATLTVGTLPSEYRKAHVPTLIVRGETTLRSAAAVAHRLATLMPAARLRTLPEAGHQGPLTHAEDMRRLLDEHFSQSIDEERLVA